VAPRALTARAWHGIVYGMTSARAIRECAAADRISAWRQDHYGSADTLGGHGAPSLRLVAPGRVMIDDGAVAIAAWHLAESGATDGAAYLADAGWHWAAYVAPDGAGIARPVILTIGPDGARTATAYGSALAAAAEWGALTDPATATADAPTPAAFAAMLAAADDAADDDYPAAAMVADALAADAAVMVAWQSAARIEPEPSAVDAAAYAAMVAPVAPMVPAIVGWSVTVAPVGPSVAPVSLVPVGPIAWRPAARPAWRGPDIAAAVPVARVDDIAAAVPAIPDIMPAVPVADLAPALAPLWREVRLLRWREVPTCYHGAGIAGWARAQVAAIFEPYLPPAPTPTR